MKKKKSIKRGYLVIYIDEFWDWAFKHKNIIDFSKFEENNLGEEPGWVKEQRKADVLKALRFKLTPWSKDEDSLLISMLNEYRYGYKEISQRLQRTEGAIKRRVLDLNLKQRPLKADNHNPWTFDEEMTLLDLRSKGYSPELIATRISRSALAIRGKVERMQKAGII